MPQLLLTGILLYVECPQLYMSTTIFQIETAAGSCQSIGLTQFSLLSNKESARELRSEHWPDSWGGLAHLIQSTWVATADAQKGRKINFGFEENDKYQQIPRQIVREGSVIPLTKSTQWCHCALAFLNPLISTLYLSSLLQLDH